ncbi:MAG: hypothetical protein K2Y71_23730 [Xanthobacteraceae bacterium]|nr:hypothetical protein [Xanthobacteraceae bacterium]
MSNMSNMARDASKDARDTVKETSKVASAGARDIQEDLEALRDDVTRLTQQLASVLASKGNKAWQRARTNVEGVISDAQDKGMEAVGAVREVGDNVVDAIDESLKKRPYTTLALAAGIGFLFGATWRR